MFGLSDEAPFYPSTVRNRALAAWKAAGLEPIGLHEARHVRVGPDRVGREPEVIQKVMGHATIRMTFDQYGNLD